MLTRRNLVVFALKSAALLPLAALAVTGGCTVGGVLAALQRYVPVGLAAFEGIVTLINPAAGSVLATVTLAVKTLWQNLQTVLAEYNAAPAANKTTVLGRVDTALNSLVGSLENLLREFGVGSHADQATGLSALMLLIATLSGIQATLPVPGAAAARARRAAMPTYHTLNGQQVAIVADPKHFKDQYNTIMRAGRRPELQLHGK